MFILFINYVRFYKFQVLFLCAFLFFLSSQLSLAADMEAVLDSADGSSTFVIQDSATTEVMYIDSDGNIITKGCIRIDSGGAECTTAENLIVDGNIGIGTINPDGKLDIEGGDVFIGTGTLTNASGSEDLSITGNLEVDGIVYGDGSGLTGLTGVTASAVAYDDITDPDGVSGINFGTNTNIWTSTNATTDFFTVNTNSITTATGLTINANAVTSGEGMKITSNSTGLTGTLVDISLTGGNAANTGEVLKVSSTIWGSASTVLMVTNASGSSSTAFRVNDTGSDSDGSPFIITANGDVGVGTVAPNRKLHVLSSGVIMDAESSNSSSYIDVIGTSNRLRIGTFGGVAGIGEGTSITPDLAINSSGDVGIGTTAPDSLLHLYSDSNPTLKIRGPSNSDSKILFVEDVALAMSLFYEGSAGSGTNNKFHIRSELSGSEENLVTVQLNGNVGIGTTSPSGKLDIEGGDVFIGTGTLTNASGSEDLSVTGNLEVDGIIYGDGSGLTGLTGVTASAIAYDDIIAPDADSGINFAGYTNTWTSTATTQDFFTINATSLTTGTAMVVTNAGGAGSLSFKVEDEVSDATPFVITDDGKVGIGMTAPSAVVHIKGADNTWNSHIRLENDTTTDYSAIIQDSDGMKFRTFTNGDHFYFRDNSNSTIMMLEDGGNVGIRTTAPVSRLDINGSVSFSTVSKTADYTATVSDYVILVNSTSANVTITLPAVSGVSGRVYIFKKTSADGNNVIIDGNGAETIDGAVTKTFSTQYEVVTIISDGTVWWVL